LNCFKTEAEEFAAKYKITKKATKPKIVGLKKFF
jgi:hypothetical protein